MTERLKRIIRNACATDEVANEIVAEMEKEEKEKTRCEYPMSNFYTYQEDVPPNIRVSNKNDCESCNEDCKDKHCLITENKGERVEKEKKCENHCPYCGSGNVDYGVSFSVSDEWNHQRGTCLDCDKCFTEVSELVYRSTIVNGE